jgi:hypothetical protein
MAAYELNFCWLVGWQWRERELREINGTSFYHVKQHEDRRLDVLGSTSRRGELFSHT